jgi:hypothetical protein
MILNNLAFFYLYEKENFKSCNDLAFNPYKKRKTSLLEISYDLFENEGFQFNQEQHKKFDCILEFLKEKKIKNQKEILKENYNKQENSYKNKKIL